MRVFAVLWFVLIAVAACTSTDKVYRTQAPGGAENSCTLDLGADNLEPVWRVNNPARCYLQSHRLPRPRPSDAHGWDEVAQSVGRPLREAGAFTLGFVEIADDGQLHLPEQLEAVKAHLAAQDRAGRQNYVIAFVHGWRHDAALRDNDVRKFRILLGYARAALSTRCVMRGEYCDAALTGVFVGWRGRSFAEPVLTTDGRFDIFSIFAAPTLFDRKQRSDWLGRGARLSQVLDGLEAELALAPGNARADKYLIFGHSLGGNMLATLMENRALATLRSGPGGRCVRGRAMAPPMGDLVVLLNPAAEARKWTRLQLAMRNCVGLTREDNQISAAVGDEVDWALWRRLRPWRTMFPIDQRPVYVSLTATDNWPRFETRGRRIAYDSATGWLFPLAQRLRGIEDPEEMRAIGHLEPVYLDAQTLGGPAIGASHEFSVNRGTGARANYRRSAEPRLSWCDPANGWLLAVRQEQIERGWSSGEGWDYGLAPDEAEGRLRAAENIARGQNSASVQWRHWQNYRSGRDLWSVVAGHSPFWNVRVLDTAVREHGGYVNYPTWCAINQLVLDDIVSPGRPDPTVEAMQKTESAVGETLRPVE